MSGKPGHADSDKSACNKALQKIREAAVRGDTAISISNNQLTALPPEIADLKNMTRLYLSRNQLTLLPPEIGELKNLKKLDLNRNELTALPHEIGQLESLDWVEVWNNPLKDPPHRVVGRGPRAILKYLRDKARKSR